MTGYGRATSAAPQSPGTGAPRFVIELRSVNHRGFDIKIRSDRPDGFCDGEIARAVRAAVERGTVTVAVREERPTATGLDPERIRSTYRVLERLRGELGLPAPVDLATVAAFLSTHGASEMPLHGEDMWTVLRPILEVALAELADTRAR